MPPKIENNDKYSIRKFIENIVTTDNIANVASAIAGQLIIPLPIIGPAVGIAVKNAIFNKTDKEIH